MIDEASRKVLVDRIITAAFTNVPEGTYVSSRDMEEAVTKPIADAIPEARRVAADASNTVDINGQRCRLLMLKFEALAGR
jgi:hypothetical protein